MTCGATARRWEQAKRGGRVPTCCSRRGSTKRASTGFRRRALLCSHGCGMDVAVQDGRMVGVRGRVDDRVNRGRLGPKGLYGWQANHHGDRLTRPLVREGGELVET